jgi:hypothetical protein
MVEGVLAVVKVARNNQYSGKIPLQVFDRTGGADNVRPNGEFAAILCTPLDRSNV